MNSFDYLNTLPQWTGKEKFDLVTIGKIASYLSNPQNQVKSVHVAGTNGKGSTSVAVAAILGAYGQCVGLNTSPHLESFNERFILDGDRVDDESIGGALSEIERASKELGLTPTYHEAVTLVAFLLFKNIDWAVYEVGLGGRLDASNILAAPKVSIITSIGYDHQLILGNSISEIAREKAGIIKQNSNLVLGSMPEDARRAILKIASDNNANVSVFSIDFNVNSLTNNTYLYQDKNVEFEFKSTLQGVHQLSNLGCAIRAALSVGVSVESCQYGLKNVFWPGRMERLVYRSKKITIDCAHNIDGIRALIENSTKDSSNQLILLGFLSRPDWQEIIIEISKAWKNILVLTPPSDRSISSSEIHEFLSCNGIKSFDFNQNYVGAIDYALNSNFDDIIISGSLYLVGALRPMFCQAEKPLWIPRKN